MMEYAKNGTLENAIKTLRNQKTQEEILIDDIEEEIQEE